MWFCLCHLICDCGTNPKNHVEHVQLLIFVFGHILKPRTLKSRLLRILSRNGNIRRVQQSLISQIWSQIWFELTGLSILISFTVF